MIVEGQLRLLIWKKRHITYWFEKTKHNMADTNCMVLGHIIQTSEAILISWFRKCIKISFPDKNTDQSFWNKFNVEQGYARLNLLLNY